MAHSPDFNVGVSKNAFNIKNNNSFNIYGDDLGNSSPLPKVYLSSSNFLWGSATVAKNTANGLAVTARCLKRKKPRHDRAPAPGDGDDDLTVTLVFDEAGSGEETLEFTFDDVTYS
jgi:hypothetical protein